MATISAGAGVFPVHERHEQVPRRGPFRGYDCTPVHRHERASEYAHGEVDEHDRGHGDEHESGPHAGGDADDDAGVRDHVNADVFLQ